MAQWCVTKMKPPNMISNICADLARSNIIQIGDKLFTLFERTRWKEEYERMNHEIMLVMYDITKNELSVKVTFEEPNVVPEISLHNTKTIIPSLFHRTDTNKAYVVVPPNIHEIDLESNTSKICFTINDFPQKAKWTHHYAILAQDKIHSFDFALGRHVTYDIRTKQLHTYRLDSIHHTIGDPIIHSKAIKLLSCIDGDCRTIQQHTYRLDSKEWLTHNIKEQGTIKFIESICDCTALIDRDTIYFMDTHIDCEMHAWSAVQEGIDMRIMKYDLREHVLSIASIAKSVCAGTSTLYSISYDLCTFGYINMIWKNKEFENLQWLPIYLIKLIAKFVIISFVYCFRFDSDSCVAINTDVL